MLCPILEQARVDIGSILDELARASRDHEDFCLFESGQGGNEVILGIGAKSNFTLEKADHQSLELFQGWLNEQGHPMGWIGYDLKNGIENLRSENPNPLDFPVIGFFEPQRILRATGTIDWSALGVTKGSPSTKLLSQNGSDSNFDINPLISREQYIQNVSKIQEHIQAGDVYELNFCQAFVGKSKEFDPLTIYKKLSTQTQAPMSGMMSLNGHYILSGSPERFIRKNGNQIISQPIKGTRPRGSNDLMDAQLKSDLAASPKDKSENVMIADLVRNDLSKIAQPGSVKAEELFGIYTFPTVHQMISTITADLKPDTKFCDIIQASFPMGSMTGAPKISAMKLIEKFEKFQRGPYSGSLGYIDSKGDFDFNVLIRSIFYNSKNETIATFAGGAITAESDPAEEYDECMVKAQSMLNALK
jgi:para-aminobenzoate synthetase component 1